MIERIKKILNGQITVSVIYILFGICLIAAPVGMVNLICKFILGILLIITGVYHVVIYILEKMNATLLDLFSGAILLVLGIFLFWNPQIVVKLLPLLLGAFVLIDSIWSLKGCIKLKRHGSSAWKIVLLGSLVFICLGIVLISNPFSGVKATIMFAGTILLLNGIEDLIFMMLLRHGLKETFEEIEEEILDEDEELEEKLSETDASVPTEVYEPWNGVTAAANRPVKQSFWQKIRKNKADDPERIIEESESETADSEEKTEDVLLEDTEEMSEEILTEMSDREMIPMENAEEEITIQEGIEVSKEETLKDSQ